MPNSYQAGVYSAVTHYLKAVQAAGTDEAGAVMARMRDLPINDFMTRNGRLRPDGRVVRDVSLFQVKRPEESTGPWDVMKRVATCGRRRLPVDGGRRLPAGAQAVSGPLLPAPALEHVFDARIDVAVPCEVGLTAAASAG